MNCCGGYSDRYLNGYGYHPVHEMNPGAFYPYHQNYHSALHNDYNHPHGPPPNTMYNNYNFNYNYYNYPYDYSENNNYDAYRTLASRFPYYREPNPYNSEKNPCDRLYSPPHHHHSHSNVNLNSNVTKDNLYSSQSSLNDDAASGISSNYSSSPVLSSGGHEYHQSATHSMPSFASRPYNRAKYENSEKVTLKKNHQNKLLSQIPNENQSWIVNKCRNRKMSSHVDASKSNPKFSDQNNKQMNSLQSKPTNEPPTQKRIRNRRQQKAAPLKNTNAEIIQNNITPLPGFQQAFGSTEIGRFSEAFFHSSDSPVESDVDNSSPQHWEGDSLEGPHFHPYYQFSNNEFPDSSPLGSCFSELTCNDF